MQDLRSFIHQAHTENWEELDLSGMELDGTAAGDCLLDGSEEFDFGGMEGGRVIDYYCER